MCLQFFLFFYFHNYFVCLQQETVPLVYDAAATQQLLGELKLANPIAELQKTMNRQLDQLSAPRAQYFLNTVHKNFSAASKSLTSEVNVSQGRSFYSQIEEFQNSEQYKMLQKILFRGGKINHVICGHLLQAVRKNLITKIKTTPAESHLGQQSTVEESAFSEVRYIGGRSIAKVKHRHMQALRRALERGMLTDQDAVQQEVISLLQALAVPQATVLLNTKYPESLVDTFRKQNLSCGLTNIDDKAFEFFKLLEEKRLPMYSSSALQRHGRDMLQVIQKQLSKDEELLQLWTDISFQVMVPRLETDHSQARLVSTRYVMR